MNNTFLITINAARIVFFVQYSKIGYGYPVAFVAYPNKAYKLDFTIDAIFNMSLDNWNDWAADAIVRTDTKEAVEELGLNYDAFVRIIGQLAVTPNESAVGSKD